MKTLHARSRSGRLLGLVAAVSIFAASLAEAKGLWERPWVAVEGPGFTLMSMLDETQTRELVLKFESFRRAAEMVTNTARTEPRIPTKLFVFPRVERALGLGPHPSSSLQPQMRANFALISALPTLREYALEHEYVHILLRTRGGRRYPPWLDEGFADFLSTVTVRDGTVRLGNPPVGVLGWLALEQLSGAGMRFGRLLEVRDVGAIRQGSQRAFYVQAWLLVHYLNLATDADTLADRQREFLALSEAGWPPVRAFERAFGIDVQDLHWMLAKHSKSLRQRVLAPKLPLPADVVELRSMPPADVAAELAALVLLNDGDAAAARRFVDAALAIEPDHGKALSWRGRLLGREGRYEEAQSDYLRAVAIDPEDAEIALDFGELYLRRAEQETDSVRQRALLAQARGQFARSDALEPDNPETLAMNGRSYLFEAADPAKAVSSLEAAHALLPSNDEIRLWLAKAYLAASNWDAAHAHLLALRAWCEGQRAAEVGALIRSLDDRVDADQDRRRAAGDEPIDRGR